MESAVFDAIININGVAYRTRIHVDVSDMDDSVFLSGGGAKVETQAVGNNQIFGEKARDEIRVALADNLN